MISNQDEWERDPSVQDLRQVFQKIEAAQEDLLAHMNISQFDSRLRPWRERTLALFERAWAMAIRQGLTLREAEVAILYTHCFVRALRLEGVNVPDGAVDQDDKIGRMFRQVIP